MPRKKSVNKEAVETVATTTFEVLPLLRKKLLRMDVVQAEHNMPMSHVQVLAMLGDAGAMSVTDISRHPNALLYPEQFAAAPQATVLILVVLMPLIEEGLLMRERNSADRRVVNVVLLPKGEEKLACIRETIVRQVMRWTGTIPEKDFFELEHALEVISTVLGSAQI